MRSTVLSIGNLVPVLTLIIGFVMARMLHATPLAASTAAADPLTKQISDLRAQLAETNTKVATNAREIRAATLSRNRTHAIATAARDWIKKPVQHGQGKWVHIGGGGAHTYTCPAGHVILGIDQKYDGGAWSHWVERVYITPISSAK